MTSPVDTSVKWFNSTMALAPAISGTVGSLAAALDAMLNTGFDTKVPASITVAGGICTIAWAGVHSAQPDAVILISGVTDAGLTVLNGEQKVVTKPNATSLTFATTAANGTVAAPSAVTFKMAPLGWNIVQTGTNVRGYQSADPASTKMILRLDDTNATFARVRGYESMTDANTGLGLFPLDAIVSGGGYWAKSINANATAVQWSLHGDGRAFYLNIQAGYSSGSAFLQTPVRIFGDAIAYKPGGDAYGCFLNYSLQATANNMIDGGAGVSNVAQHAAPRDYTGLGSSVTYSAIPFMLVGSSHFSGITGSLSAFPSPVDGGLWLSQKYLGAGGSAPRALMPGILQCMQSGMFNYFKMGDRAPGTGALAGRSLMASYSGGGSANFNGTTDATTLGIVFFDITGPWR